MIINHIFYKTRYRGYCLKNLLISVDISGKKIVSSIGEIALLAIKGVKGIFTPPFNLKLVIREVDSIGVKSLFLVSIIALFTGMVLSLQTIYGLGLFGAELYVGSVVSLTIVREMGPVLTAIMVGGRIGSGMAAEIGSMQVTEQIDAIRALGANPIKKLVTPRIIAAMFVLPLLTVAADIIGITGGLLIGIFELNISYQYYLNTIWFVLTIPDLYTGIGKTVFFGFIIAIIGCYYGLQTKGGTTGVGKSATITVVTVSILILTADFFLTKIFLLLFGF